MRTSKPWLDNTLDIPHMFLSQIIIKKLKDKEALLFVFLSPFLYFKVTSSMTPKKGNYYHTKSKQVLSHSIIHFCNSANLKRSRSHQEGGHQVQEQVTICKKQFMDITLIICSMLGVMAHACNLNSYTVKETLSR